MLCVGARARRHVLGLSTNAPGDLKERMNGRHTARSRRSVATRACSPPARLFAWPRCFAAGRCLRSCGPGSRVGGLDPARILAGPCCCWAPVLPASSRARAPSARGRKGVRFPQLLVLDQVPTRRPRLFGHRTRPVSVTARGWCRSPHAAGVQTRTAFTASELAAGCQVPGS